VICGLTRFVNKGHIARAALEATAFQTREVLEAMVKDSGVAISELRVAWRHGRERYADAVSGDILNVPVGAAAGDRDKLLLGAGLRGGARRRLLAISR